MTVRDLFAAFPARRRFLRAPRIEAQQIGQSMRRFALAHPAVAFTLSFDGQLGTMTLEEAVDRFLCVDLVVHGWDLARASGQDDTIDPIEVEQAGQGVGHIDDSMLRQPGVLGPALEPPAGADAQTRLLAFLGRRAW